MAEAVRVLVVSDDPLARGGLAMLVASEGFEVVGPYSPIDALRSGLLSPVPALAAWDVGGDAGFDRLRELEGRVPVVALVEDESLASEALASGVRGVLFRDAPAARLGSALRAVIEGNFVIDEALGSLLRQRVPTASPAEALTPREAEVLQHLAQGLSNKQIAQRLNVSEHTAKFHVNSIMGKLGAQSRTEAVVRAARTGLLIL